jgi:hypothetical protein
MFRNVEIADILSQLAGRSTNHSLPPDITPEKVGQLVGGGDDYCRCVAR